MNETIDLTNRRPLAVVTGASNGIGQALAVELTERGHDLVVAAEDAGIEDPALLGDAGRPVRAVRTDLAEAAGVRLLHAQVQQLGRPVDVLVVNAGVALGKPFVERDIEDHLRLVDLNGRGAVHLAGLVIPEMVARGRGRVLFSSSIVASMPGPY